MFKGAIGGGLIVGFLCVIKVLMSKVETSDFGFAFLYSLNYSIGFILIYLFGFTLATKQPAMTATTISKAIEEGLKQLGVSQEEVDIKILSQGGLFKKAKVELTLDKDVEEKRN